MKSKIRIVTAVFCLVLSNTVLAHGDDDPLLAMFKVEQLEQQFAEEHDILALHAKAWFGYDLNKLWVKVDAKQEQSELHELEVQALYSHAIHAYWDVQVGVRADFKPEPERNWAVLGIQGLAPYFFEVDAALFLSEDGDGAARLNAEYELMLTQRLVLTPEIELNFYSQNNEEYFQGSGLAGAEAGLRLRYEIRRELAFYVGMVWEKAFGQTRDYLFIAGEDDEDSRAVVGVSFWF